MVKREAVREDEDPVAYPRNEVKEKGRCFDGES